MPLVAMGMVEENGTLTGFLMGTCETCAYDNWQSHVSERIVRPGYNDYGPSHLDPQTAGFGGFSYIYSNAAGDSTLARWRAVFDYAVNAQWHEADSLIQRYDSLWNYEMVAFDEPASNRRYYIMRERLDTLMVDVNGDTVSSNDVYGSFHKGWGVFVFAEAPRHSRAVLQLPHPEDDFLSIPVGIEMFQQAELAVLSIAGAGREVMWDSTQSQYTNARSLSDPSRNARHPFAVLSKAVTDAWNEPPLNPLVVIQLHSYDHATHLSLPDIQMSCFLDDSKPNPPVRDVAEHLDFFHGLPFYPVTEVDGDQSIVVSVNQYAGLFSSPQYTYYGQDTTCTIFSVGDLYGAPGNVEAEYCHVGHNVLRDTENFIHIELDEYPDRIWMPLNWTRWIPGAPPTDWDRFTHALSFYQPFITAIDSALTWHALPDTTAPDSCALVGATDIGGSDVYLRWDHSAFDRHFDTYQIFYDTVAVTLASPHISRGTAGFSALGDQLTCGIQMNNFALPVWRYQFAIRAKDVLGYESPLSGSIGITDGQIDDLAIKVEGDSLRLNWSLQTNDSLFKVYSYIQEQVDYTIIGTTTANTFMLAPFEEPVLYRLNVKRIIRR
ncbi:MAG: hypothetical protein IPG71_03020 [bacterium]|nr:hypothetical protein [bacterium]